MDRQTRQTQNSLITSIKTQLHEYIQDSIQSFLGDTIF